MKANHESHMLIYAIDKNGNLVHIDKVKSGNECACVCPACKEPLTAKNNGKKRVHHFAHQSGCECSSAYETMLHLLAKEKIQEAFLNKEKFYIDYEYRSYCSDEKQCKYIRYKKCVNKSRKSYNLKEIFDKCEKEVIYDGSNRRSDLKIYSSTIPNIEPIYIEFCVTHASDEEKLLSGKQIIECLIENEEDIENIVVNGFVEDKIVHNDYEQSSTPKIQFYGFNDNNSQLNCDIQISRYVLYESGRIYYSNHVCKCREIKRIRENSLYEIFFHSKDSSDIRNYAIYMCYEKFHIRNCMLCKNCVNFYRIPGKICRLYRSLNIDQENFDTTMAKTCQYFTFNQEEMEEVKEKGCDVPYEEFVDNTREITSI